jgi:hypothetical protein
VLSSRLRPEILMGRSAAMCVHPYAAWRTSSVSGRLFVFTAYATAAYAVVLGLMLLRA